MAYDPCANPPGHLRSPMLSPAPAQCAAGLGMTVLAYDPYANPEKAAALGVTIVSMDEALARVRPARSCRFPSCVLGWLLGAAGSPGRDHCVHGRGAGAGALGSSCPRLLPLPVTGVPPPAQPALPPPAPDGSCTRLLFGRAAAALRL